MNTLILIFYRIAAFFTRVPKKTSEINLAKNTHDDTPLINPDGFIENQGTIETVHFGSCALKNNGCGPIATFNALNALGRKPDIDDFFKIIRAYEKKGAAFRARLGTSPISIKNYIDSLGFKTKSISTDSRYMLEKFSHDYDTFISIIKNDAKHITSGLHYICIHKTADGKYITHNPNREAYNLFDVLDMCSSKDIKHVYTIGIKRDNKQDKDVTA